MSKKKEKTTKPTLAKTFLEALAFSEAKENKENNFQSRRGIYAIEAPSEKGEVLCLYNNNPYARSPSLREEETQRFREVLKQAGIPELAYATYPTEGDEGAGYTYVMLLDAGEEQMDFVTGVVEEATRETYDIMNQDQINL